MRLTSRSPTGVVNGHSQQIQGSTEMVLLLVIVTIGAPVLLGYRELTVTWKRLADLWLLGTLAAGATLFAVYAAYMMARLAGFLSETDQSFMALMATFLPAVVAGFLWWAFARIGHGKPV